jgi:hypothetical protein
LTARALAGNESEIVGRQRLSDKMG